MSMFKFPSLAQPDKIGFMFDSQHRSKYAQVDEALLFFDTYGDGMCQHSPEVCTLAEQAADYFASLAAFLLERPDEAQSCRSRFEPDWPDAKIEFAASVVYKAPAEGKYEKPRYFSMEEKKVSSSESKRHDRRYTRIEPWMDGTGKAIIQLLWQDWFSPLQTFALNHAVRDWSFKGNNDRPWVELPKLGKDSPREMANEQERAFQILQGTVQHIVGMECCRGNVERWKESLEYKRKKAAETVVLAEAANAA
jgi:hypothetical protein